MWLRGPALQQADPHPGNLIRTPDGRLCILDFGLMCRIDNNIKFGMIEAVSHLIHRYATAPAMLDGMPCTAWYQPHLLSTDTMQGHEGSTSATGTSSAPVCLQLHAGLRLASSYAGTTRPLCRTL